MTQITNNFNLEEFKCKGGSEMPLEVADNLIVLIRSFLQPLRTYLGIPIIITSGYRCVEYNRKVGGVRNSQHILGTAADIVVKGIPIYSLRDALNLALKAHKNGPGGLGYYPRDGANWGFLHVDLRETTRAVRWSG